MPMSMHLCKYLHIYFQYLPIVFYYNWKITKKRN